MDELLNGIKPLYIQKRSIRKWCPLLPVAEWTNCSIELNVSISKSAPFTFTNGWIYELLDGIKRLYPKSPWYNRTGSLGVKHKLTYSIQKCIPKWWPVLPMAEWANCSIVLKVSISKSVPFQSGEQLYHWMNGRLQCRLACLVHGISWALTQSCSAAVSCLHYAHNWSV